VKTDTQISVAMCTYNGSKYVADQLESIAKQTRLPYELVVCDDRSSDSTQEIVRKFAETAPLEVRLVVNPENLGSAKKGVTRNFEKASGLCRGEFIAMCDQDDVWLPAKLEHLAGVLENNPHAGAVFSNARIIDSQSKPTGATLSEANGFTQSEDERLRAGEVLPVLLSMTKVYGCTLMVRAELLRKILPVPPSWWFDAWLSCMSAVLMGLEYVPEPLFCYRVHPSQQVGASVATVSQRMKQMRSSAKDFWKDSEPQLKELYERLELLGDPQMESNLSYLRGRQALLAMRANLPENRLLRMGKILPQAKNYHRYFNGWKSIIKDLAT
jgi:glycosyltransferase involved in cell wall biosynthesis